MTTGGVAYGYEILGRVLVDVEHGASTGFGVGGVDVHTGEIKNNHFLNSDHGGEKNLQSPMRSPRREERRLGEANEEKRRHCVCIDVACEGGVRGELLELLDQGDAFALFYECSG